MKTVIRNGRKIIQFYDDTMDVESIAEISKGLSGRNLRHFEDWQDDCLQGLNTWFQSVQYDKSFNHRNTLVISPGMVLDIENIVFQALQKRFPDFDLSLVDIWHNSSRPFVGILFSPKKA